MNIDRLKEVRELIAVTPKENFHMGDFYRELQCKTMCCIAGTSVMHFNPSFAASRYTSTGLWVREFAILLDCSYSEAEDIAIPQDHDMTDADMPNGWTTWTIADAVKWLNYWINVYQGEIE